MSKEIEVSLRIPRNTKTPLLDDNGYPLDTSAFRFKTVMQVPAIPRAGESLDVIASGRTLKATVVRADWSEDRGMFVVACQYANRSIAAEEQNALVADERWRLEPLV